MCYGYEATKGGRNLSLGQQIPKRTDGTVCLSVEERFFSDTVGERFCWREVLLDKVGRKFYQTHLEKGYLTVGESLP